ncbi:hypothetical protein LTR66_014759 [Elasticomyces elasticus]|nr:hypothetical protein LTR66_014759 [Elasticomyces elasticus]
MVDQYVALNGCGRAFTSKATLIEHIRTAHFQLPSMRAKREYGRKIKRELEDDTESVTSVSKRRLGGRTGKSALSQLTGLKFDDSPTTTNQYSLVQTEEDLVQTQFLAPLLPDSLPANSIDTDASDFNQLSGSVTMIGSHIYRHSQAHHLVEDDGDDEQAILDEPQYIPCAPDRGSDHPTLDDDADEFFIFDHEAELIHPHIDPQLLKA